MTKSNIEGVILALDIGSSRIGVAQARSDVRIAHPLRWMPVAEDIVQRIKDVINEQEAEAVVIGLPRGLQGQETEQTKAVRKFASELKDQVDAPLYWQDEALTSRKAEQLLEASGKSYEKGDIDAQAAAYILQDFLEDTIREQV